MSDAPVVVGVAGKCCAGKDEVTRWLLARGFREVNVDRIGHEALAVKHREIVAAFGPEIVTDGVTIDRAVLGARVFADKAERLRLEAIVHPWMRERVTEEVAAFREHPDAAGLVINAALLFPMALDRLCDRILLVRAPLLQRVRRARERDDLSLRRMVRRLWAQRALDTQAHRSPADTIIVENGRSREELYRRLSEIDAFPSG